MDEGGLGRQEKRKDNVVSFEAAGGRIKEARRRNAINQNPELPASLKVHLAREEERSKQRTEAHDLLVNLNNAYGVIVKISRRLEMSAGVEPMQTIKKFLTRVKEEIESLYPEEREKLQQLRKRFEVTQLEENTRGLNARVVSYERSDKKHAREISLEGKGVLAGVLKDHLSRW